MSAKIEVRLLGTDEYDRWERFVAEAPGGNVYALPRYLDVLCAATDATYRVVAALRGGEILAGIALYERQNSAGTYVDSRLLLYYNGPIFAAPRSKYPSQNTSLYLKLVNALDAWIAEQGYAHVCLKSRGDVTDVRPFQEHGWSVEPAYTYEVALNDLDAAFGRVESNYRRLILRCERDGFQLVADDDFDTFFRLHNAIHERKSAPLYLPRARFRAYFEQLRERDLCRLYHARLPDGTAAASQLVLLGPHPVAHTVAAGATAEHLTSGASVFLRWKALEALAADGYTGNDLTDAALNNVTRFKSQLGGNLRLSMVLTRPPTAKWRLKQRAVASADFTKRSVRYSMRRIGGR